MLTSKSPHYKITITQPLCNVFSFFIIKFFSFSIVSSIQKLKNQPKLDYDVNFGQKAQKFKFSNRPWEYEILSLKTEIDVIVKFGLFLSFYNYRNCPWTPDLCDNDNINADIIVKIGYGREVMQIWYNRFQFCIFSRIFVNFAPNWLEKSNYERIYKEAYRIGCTYTQAW